MEGYQAEASSSSAAASRQVERLKRRSVDSIKAESIKSENSDSGRVNLHDIDTLRIATPDVATTESHLFDSSSLIMADGLNQIRAMRITEIMTDYRNIQSYLAAIRANPSAEEYNEDGFVVLRRCVASAQALLAQPFTAPNPNGGDEEQNKQVLRRIIVDASVRRFRAQKLYMQATAALRWVNARAVLLKGQPPHAGHAAALQQIRNILRTELAAVTDARVEASLRQADTAAGKWTAEDPPLATIQRVIGANGGR